MVSIGRIFLNPDYSPLFTSTMRIMKVSARPGMEGLTRAMGGIFELPDSLSDGEIVTVCSPVDHGYLQVRNVEGEVFTVAMQERSTAAPSTRFPAGFCHLKTGESRSRSPSSEPAASATMVSRKRRRESAASGTHLWGHTGSAAVRLPRISSSSSDGRAEAFAMNYSETAELPQRALRASSKRGALEKHPPIFFRSLRTLLRSMRHI